MLSSQQRRERANQNTLEVQRTCRELLEVFLITSRPNQSRCGEFHSGMRESPHYSLPMTSKNVLVTTIEFVRKILANSQSNGIHEITRNNVLWNFV